MQKTIETLSDGWSAFAGPRGVLTLRPPGGGFVDVPAVVDPAQWIIETQSTEGAATLPVEVLEQFRRAGILTETSAEPQRPSHIWLIGGSNTLAQGLALATGRSVTVSDEESVAAMLDSIQPAPPDGELAPDDGLARPDVVCWISYGPAPLSWLTVGDRLPERGIGWIRATCEGDLLYIEPPAWKVGDVLHNDVLARRLCSSAAVDHLRFYFSSAVPKWAPHAICPARELLMASLLATVLSVGDIAEPPASCGRSDGPRLPAGDVLLIADLRTGLVDGHSVFAMPTGEGVPA